MPQKTARKKLLMMLNGTPPDVGPPPPPRCVWGPITQTRGWTSFGTQGGPTSPPEWNRTPGMLLGSIQGLWWPSSSSATMRMHPHAEGPMATLLLRSTRSSKVPQAASSLAMPPEPPAEHAAAKDQHVHGSAGGHQVATMPSSSSMEAPFPTSSAAMLSAHQAKHDSESTRCMESSAKRLAPRSMRPHQWSPRIMPLVLGEARESWRCPAGGAEHTRSSLSVVQMDAAPVSTAAVASSRPREHPEGPPSAWSVVGGCYIKK